MKKIIAGLSVFALSLSVAPSALADVVTGTNTTGNMQASHNITIEVEVLDTLSLDCYDAAGTTGDHTVTLGDSTTGLGYVVAGVPSVGKSRCNVLTNDDQGYFLTIERSTEDVTWADDGGMGSGQHATASNVLIHEDVNVDGTWYEIPDTLAAYDGTNSAAWTDGTTKGFGFSVVAFPDGDLSNNTLDEDWTLAGTLCADGTTGGDVAEYAGVPAAAQAISAVTQYEALTTTTDVCYKVDVLSTQQSGEYAGQVTFTATTDASIYL